MKMPGIGEKRLDQFFVFAPLLGERFIKQTLVRRVGGRGRVAQSLMRGRNDGVKPENEREQSAFLFREVKNVVVVFDAKKFHSSRSMVACRLYF